VWGLFVLLLTTLPGKIPLVSVLTEFIGGTEESALLGHVGLFAMLTLLTWRALINWFAAHHALFIAVVGALLLGTGTEFFQWFVSDRTSTLYDLFANWLGVFAVGFAISYAMLIVRLRKSGARVHKTLA
jgi:VanZ family protein